MPENKRAQRIETWRQGELPEFEPDRHPFVVDVFRQGFDEAGKATFLKDKLIVTKRLREPYSSDAKAPSYTPDQVVLSDYVYEGDSLDGVINGSKVKSPQPLAYWGRRDGRIVGGKDSAEVIVFHHDARDGEQVACVEFVWSDGKSEVVAKISKVRHSQRGERPAPRDRLRVEDVDISGLTKGDLALDVSVYPHFDDETSVLDSRDVTSRAELCTQRNLKVTQIPPMLAVVDPNKASASDATGITSVEADKARAQPFASLRGALEKLGKDGRKVDRSEVYLRGDLEDDPPVKEVKLNQETAALVIRKDPEIAGPVSIQIKSVPKFESAATKFGRSMIVYKDLKCRQN